MAQLPSQVKLVPYTIDSIVDKTNETPIGVSLIQAPAIWEESNQGEGVVIAVIDTVLTQTSRSKRSNYWWTKFYI